MDDKKKIEAILLNDYGCFDDFTVDKLYDLFSVSKSLPLDQLYECDKCNEYYEPDESGICPFCSYA